MHIDFEAIWTFLQERSRDETLPSQCNGFAVLLTRPFHCSFKLDGLSRISFNWMLGTNTTYKLISHHLLALLSPVRIRLTSQRAKCSNIFRQSFIWFLHPMLKRSQFVAVRVVLRLQAFSYFVAVFGVLSSPLLHDHSEWLILTRTKARPPSVPLEF